MSSAMIQFRVDEDLKRKATEVYEQIGLDLPSAMRMFMKRSIVMRGLPFPATIPTQRFKSEEEMSKAEFDAMLNKGVEEAKAEHLIDAATAFKQVRELINHE